MLIIAPKCISTFSSQVILNDVHYHNIISIIIDKFHARAWPWLHASTIYLVPFSNPSGADIQWCKIVLHAPNQLCSVASFWSFPSGGGFLIAASKALKHSSSWEALTTWPNKYNCFKLVMSSDKNKTLAWKCTWWGNLQSLFKFSTFLENAAKFYLRNMHFQQQRIFLALYLNLYCQI